jgi:hypothetical protein
MNNERAKSCHHFIIKNVTKDEDSLEFKKRVAAQLERMEDSNRNLIAVERFLLFSEPSREEGKDVEHIIMLRLQRNSHTSSAIRECITLLYSENARVRSELVHDWLRLLSEMTSSAIYPVIMSDSIDPKQLHINYYMKQCAANGFELDDYFFSELPPNTARAAKNHYLECLGRLESSDLAPHLEPILPETTGFLENDYRLQLVRAFNEWAFYLQSIRRGQRKWEANKMKHIWVHGPSNVGKTHTVRDILLRNLKDHQIFIPNGESMLAAWQGFHPDVHRVVLIDEAAELQSTCWNIDKLKEILGGRVTKINQKQKGGLTVQVKVKIIRLTLLSESFSLFV